MLAALERVDWAAKAAWVDKQVDRGVRAGQATQQATTRGWKSPLTLGIGGLVSTVFLSGVAAVAAPVLAVGLASWWGVTNYQRRKADRDRARETYETAIREQMADNEILERQRKFQEADVAAKTARFTAQAWDEKLQTQFGALERYQQAQTDMVAHGNHIRAVLSRLHNPGADLAAIETELFNYEAFQQGFMTGLEPEDRRDLSALDNPRPQLADLINDDGTPNRAAIAAAQQRIAAFNQGIADLPRPPADLMAEVRTFLSTPVEARTDQQMTNLLDQLRHYGGDGLANELEVVQQQVRANLAPTDPLPAPEALQLPPPEAIGGYTAKLAQKTETRLKKKQKKVDDQQRVVDAAAADVTTQQDTLNALPEVTPREMNFLERDLESALNALHATRAWTTVEAELNQVNSDAAAAKLSHDEAKTKLAAARQKLEKLGVKEDPLVAPAPDADDKARQALDRVNLSLGIEDSDPIQVLKADDAETKTLKRRAQGLRRELETNEAKREAIDCQKTIEEKAQVIADAQVVADEIVADMEGLENGDPAVRTAKANLKDGQDKKAAWDNQEQVVATAEDKAKKAKGLLTEMEGERDVARQNYDSAQARLQEAQQALFDKLEAEIKEDRAREARAQRAQAYKDSLARQQQAEADRQVAATQGQDGAAAPVHMYDTGGHYPTQYGPQYGQQYGMQPQWAAYPQQPQQWAQPGWQGMPQGYPVQVWNGPGYGQPMQVPVQGPYQGYAPQYGQPAVPVSSAMPTVRTRRGGP